MTDETHKRSPIGIWQPDIVNGEEVFVRPDPGPLGDDWCPRKYLQPRRGPLPLRVCLIGESTAAGFFYAPQLTPASVLAHQLNAIKGSEAFEVIDLTKIDMPADGSTYDLVRVTVAALQLDPDVLVIFAGNNWLKLFRPSASYGPDYLRSFAAAYEDAGARGIMEQCEQNTRNQAAGVVKNLSYIAATVPVSLVLVIPEVNQTDWARCLPVAWLPGNRTSEWQTLYAKASTLKRDPRNASLVKSLAEQMIKLDEGTCPVSYRLLADALAAQGRTAETREMLMREVDSAAWNACALPGASSTVREVLQSVAGNPHMTCVDLPKKFFEHTGKLPGKEMFLDYCHLTLDGIKVAMAAVASEVLRLTGGDEQTFDYRSLLQRLPGPEVSPAKDALAKFLAALYTIHWERRFDSESPMPRYWCEAAIDAWSGIQDTMLEYVATLIASPSALGLSVAEQRFFGRQNCFEDGSHWWAGEGRRLRRFSLDPVAINLICEVLEQSGRPVRNLIDKQLVDQHANGNGPRREIDLLNPCYHWTTMDELTSIQNDTRTYSGYGLYQAFEPASNFCFVSDENRGVQLDLTARLATPAKEEGLAAIQVNGKNVGRLQAGRSWIRMELKLGRECLRTGINKLTIVWPELSADGDAATRNISERLRRGIPANLEPVFGEIQSLVARS
ncbi:MAG TPA: hypothetical protein VJU86_15730 [Pyrinomonadaceae bacterium]|nr:hypothetical protein [Pyrinomonadaceae bacterium]